MERSKQRNDNQVDRRRNERCRQFLLLEMSERIVLDVKTRRREFAVDNSVEYLRLRLAHKQRVNHRLPLIWRRCLRLRLILWRYWWWCILVHNHPIKINCANIGICGKKCKIFLGKMMIVFASCCAEETKTDDFVASRK